MVIKKVYKRIRGKIWLFRPGSLINYNCQIDDVFTKIDMTVADEKIV